MVAYIGFRILHEAWHALHPHCSNSCRPEPSTSSQHAPYADDPPPSPSPSFSCSSVEGHLDRVPAGLRLTPREGAAPVEGWDAFLPAAVLPVLAWMGCG